MAWLGVRWPQILTGVLMMAAIIGSAGSAGASPEGASAVHSPAAVAAEADCSLGFCTRRPASPLASAAAFGIAVLAAARSGRRTNRAG